MDMARPLAVGLMLYAACLAGAILALRQQNI
jgi:hypothetical protein